MVCFHLPLSFHKCDIAEIWKWAKHQTIGFIHMSTARQCVRPLTYQAPQCSWCERSKPASSSVATSQHSKFTGKHRGPKCVSSSRCCSAGKAILTVSVISEPSAGWPFFTLSMSHYPLKSLSSLLYLVATVRMRCISRFNTQICSPLTFLLEKSSLLTSPIHRHLSMSFLPHRTS